jgi:pimeloyl-ACP methyl ester carboxylesterase
LANFDTGLVALEYAARHPDAVAGLVLVNCYATYQRGRGYPHGVDPETARQLIDAAVDPSRHRPLDTSVLVAPSLATSAEFRTWWNRIGQRGANPTTARIVRTVATTTDVRHRLHAVTCPVLIVPRRQCANVDPAHSAYLAEHLPRGRLHPVDGADGVWFTDDGIVGLVAGFAATVA